MAAILSRGRWVNIDFDTWEYQSILESLSFDQSDLKTALYIATQYCQACPLALEAKGERSIFVIGQQRETGTGVEEIMDVKSMG